MSNTRRASGGEPQGQNGPALNFGVNPIPVGPDGKPWLSLFFQMGAVSFSVGIPAAMGEQFIAQFGDVYMEALKAARAQSNGHSLVLPNDAGQLLVPKQ